MPLFVASKSTRAFIGAALPMVREKQKGLLKGGVILCASRYYSGGHHTIIVPLHGQSVIYLP